MAEFRTSAFAFRGWIYMMSRMRQLKNFPEKFFSRRHERYQNRLKLGIYVSIFSRILPFGPKWQDCFDTFCSRAQKVQNKGWRSTA